LVFNTEKGLRCSECILTYKDILASGFGRNHEEAQANAIKSLFDYIIERDYKINALKQSLKLIEKNANYHENISDRKL
jgi:protein-arginine kinase activator protein McsA